MILANYLLIKGTSGLFQKATLHSPFPESSFYREFLFHKGFGGVELESEMGSSNSMAIGFKMAATLQFLFHKAYQLGSEKENGLYFWGAKILSPNRFHLNFLVCIFTAKC
jgi:hypothetical protein